MKHSVSVVLVLLALFLSAQLIGLLVVHFYVDVSASAKASAEAGEPVTVYSDLPYGVERPAIAPDSSFIFLSVAIVAGTALMLLLMRFRVVSLWKLWFFGALVITLGMAFSAFLPAAIAGVISVIIAFFRVIRPNVLVHNISELFVYGGLAAIFVPRLSVKSAFILLAIIAAYDIFAVFMSQHMVSLARFQTENRLFAGLFVPKQLSAKAVISPIPASIKQQPKEAKETCSDSGSYAIVGGGDIGFPILFAGAAMAVFGFKAFVIPIFSTAALAVLFAISKKGRFYPAMPFIAVGCFAGYAILQMV